MKRKVAPAHKKKLNKDETEQQLITVLKDLEGEVEKQNSLRQVFIRGAINGLGTVIGATILLALLGSIIAITVDILGIGNIPFLDNLIENINSR